VQFARDVRSLPIARPHYLGGELSRTRAVGGEAVQEKIDRAAHLRDVAIGEKRRPHARVEVSACDVRRRTLERLQRTQREEHEGGVHDEAPRERQAHDEEQLRVDRIRRRGTTPHEHRRGERGEHDQRVRTRDLRRERNAQQRAYPLG